VGSDQPGHGPSRRSCPLCGGDAEPAFEVGDRNRGLGPERFAYRRCRSCDAIFLTDIPADLARYYAADGYGSAEDELTPELREREQAKLRMLSSVVAGGSMVEIGPGPGLFTRVAKSEGYDVTAIEMDPGYCRYLRDDLGVRVMQSDTPQDVLAELPPSDAIVMWHSLEHLPDPRAVLERAADNLAPGGVLAVSTPNRDSLQFRLMGRYWTHVDAPRHLQLIPARALADFLAARGLGQVHITTTDPVGLVLDRAGWEAAVRRHPARRPPSMSGLHLARAITIAMSPVERRDLNGAAYTALFTRAGTSHTAPDAASA
jgi:SAM-dependent methyltransferase